MRFASFLVAGKPSYGIVDGDHLRDLSHRVGDAYPGLRSLIASGRAGAIAVEHASGAPRYALNAVTPLPPIPDPDKIVCIGLNYAKHAAEGRQEIPESPTIFGKYRNALVADGATVHLPEASRKVDYEAEVAFVVGRQAKAVGEADALDFVAGYTLFNDLSARDLQFSTPQWMSGKVFDGSAPCGPALVTPDEAGPADGIEIELTLNGERMQGDSTANQIFGVAKLVSHLSSLMTLEPGDIIATGTPDGVGGAREPRVWLGDGDELVVSSPTLGRLTTKIAR
jgi:2-keto-4-pentenoate hydratase/2-oxohepta-3-ene-1,7-dioic acid hydratase in catechol pathway